MFFDWVAEYYVPFPKEPRSTRPNRVGVFMAWKLLHIDESFPMRLQESRDRIISFAFQRFLCIRSVFASRVSFVVSRQVPPEVFFFFFFSPPPFFFR